jgi:hypothetical protein
LWQTPCFVRPAFALNLGNLCIGHFGKMADSQMEFKIRPDFAAKARLGVLK